MRSPVIAFGLFAAAAVSPTLVSAAPTSPNLPNGLTAPAQGLAGPADSVHTPITRELKHTTHHNKHERRDEDFRTAGGNAYSGVSGDVSGGNQVNEADNDDDTITNADSSECLAVLILLVRSYLSTT